MKKISVFIILALLLSVQLPSNAGIISTQKDRIEQTKIKKTTTAAIKALFEEYYKQANAHNLIGLQSMYSKDFVNSDGFDYESSSEMIKESWATYPDISYSYKIENIDFNDNFATVTVTEQAFATSKEDLESFSVIGELYSTSKCIYHLQKHGTIWLIHSEDVADEVTTLKFGEARYINLELYTPKQVGAKQNYTAILKVEPNPDTFIIGTIGKTEIKYPQNNPDDSFRRLGSDNILERVFQANDKNLNECVSASIGITHVKDFDETHVKIYMSGLAFIMKKINVIPENNFIDKSNFNRKDKDEQNK